jgi:protein gp37
VTEKLEEPLRWNKAKMVFVNSMSDLFHPSVPDSYIESVARVMAVAPWHTFQVLTKRAERLKELLNDRLAFAARLDHIWWGVSVENRKHGIPRIAQLQEAKAKVRFLSVEPLLEDVGTLNLRGIHWMIVGGESGFGARPIEEDWVLSLKGQCDCRGIPFFFKQWGGARKWLTGRQLAGKTYDAMPIRLRRSIPDASTRAQLAHIISKDARPTHSSMMLRA